MVGGAWSNMPALGAAALEAEQPVTQSCPPSSKDDAEGAFDPIEASRAEEDLAAYLATG
jgi:hypothetical protein